MLRRPARPYLALLLLALTACASQPPSTPPAALPQEAAPPAAPPTSAEPSQSLSIIQRGKASYYADGFGGRPTATGVPFDQNALTAASKVIPLGAKAKITNLRTGKSVIVEVNDRGPRVPGRIIDLSKRAADQIGIDKGIARVKVEARVGDQPTLALRQEVAEIAAARGAKKKRKPEVSTTIP